MRKIALAFVAAAFAVATVGVPVDNVAHAAAHAKKKKKKAKAGKCGTYMYFDKKSRKCADARKKR